VRAAQQEHDGRTHVNTAGRPVRTRRVDRREHDGRTDADDGTTDMGGGTTDADDRHG
jgi:hypothetical protein